MMTAESLARELFASVAFDDDASIAVSTLRRIAEREGFLIDPCHCGGYPDDHADGCICAGCSLSSNHCGCDPAYERGAGK